MSKQFIKLVEDEELYKSVREYILDIDRPKYTEGMSCQDYGALCIAYDKLVVKLKERLDSLWREGEESKQSMI